MKQRAVKKVQLAIDKMVDLQEMAIDDSLRMAVVRVLEGLRHLEAKLSDYEVKGGILKQR